MLSEVRGVWELWNVCMPFCRFLDLDAIKLTFKRYVLELNKRMHFSKLELAIIYY